MTQCCFDCECINQNSVKLLIFLVNIRYSSDADIYKAVFASSTNITPHLNQYFISLESTARNNSSRLKKTLHKL